MDNTQLTELLTAFRAGDRTAFEKVYRSMQAGLYTVIFRITWDRGLSEDILQEVFCKLYLSPPGPAVNNPRAYIFQTARNLAIDSMRAQRPAVSLDEIEAVVHRPMDDIPLRMDIDAALKALPAEQRQIVTLHLIGNLKFREIAGITGVPLGTVLWKYQKALGSLRKKLTGDAL